jgi:hypothetical protein
MMTKFHASGPRSVRKKWENKSDLKYYLSSAIGSYSPTWSVSKCCQGSSSILIMLKQHLIERLHEVVRDYYDDDDKLKDKVCSANFSCHFYSQNRFNVLF